MFKLTIKTPERRQWFVLVSLLLTLKIFSTFSIVFIVEFEQVKVSWDVDKKDSYKSGVNKADPILQKHHYTCKRLERCWKHWNIEYQPSRHLHVKFNNGNTTKMCEICLKLTVSTLERRRLCCWLWKDFTHSSGVSILGSEQVYASWKMLIWYIICFE